MVSKNSNRREPGGSPLQIYLMEINETPLLSAEEERELAEKVAAGDPYAREHMVKANLRLVVNIARGYLGKGLNLEDLIEEGNLGLMRAVEGFDGMMETRFSTYASYWIKQSIRRAVMNNGKPIRLPAYMVSLLAKWKRASNILAERLGRQPTIDEVGKALKLSKKKIGIVAKAIRVNSLTHQMENSEDDKQILDDILTDDRGKGVEDVMIETDDLERVFDRLDALDDREAARAGGDSGPAVAPGLPDESLLLLAVEQGADAEVEPMPPKGKLPDAAIADLRRWIEQGAFDPRDASEPGGEEAAKGRWALRPIEPPAVPELDGADL
ncbi:hypothetical protein HK102_013031, partial [Quaeritorhiza haematococci]